MTQTSDPIARLSRHILEQSVARSDGDPLLEDICVGLVEAGIPLLRMSISTPAIDPAFRGISLTWQRGAPLELRAAAHTGEGAAEFLRSPINVLLSEDLRYAAWRLDGTERYTDLPLLEELREAGGTEYVIHLVDFAPGTALMGVAISFATDRAGGFAEPHRAAFAELLPAIALATCKFNLAGTLREALSTYLGPRTGARVLDGHMRRGEGEAVAAAILLADLRGFTALADRDDPLRVVGWLDEHFDALGEPIAHHGGEVVKFLGDGFLAIFPVTDPAARPCAVCDDALSAARLALGRNRDLNLRRQTAGLPQLDADVVLHYGSVIYGNVGTGRRLDFTVIGKAVNEASRIEALCEAAGQPLLLSDAFAERCGHPLETVGTFPLRGVDKPQRLWVPRA